MTVLLVSHDPTARAAIWGTIGTGAFAELAATYYRRRDLFRTARAHSAADRGTKQVVVVALVGAILASVLIANSAPALRAGANTWGALGLGVAVLAAGEGMRVWAVATLGRFFRREVTIVSGQTVIETGPYRYVRHPAYVGDLLIVFGFGLAWGSWVGAAAALVIAFVGHLPRIRVEEAALREAFGEPYERYAARHARLLPGVW
jgi:protein-S-isoprenylcysteine O-methyltransferase Ste14